MVNISIGLAQDTPRSSSQHKGVLFTPEGQRAGNKKQRWEIDDKGEGGKELKRGEERIFVGGQSGAKDCFWIERRQLTAHEKMPVYKDKEETLC